DRLVLGFVFPQSCNSRLFQSGVTVRSLKVEAVSRMSLEMAVFAVFCPIANEARRRQTDACQWCFTLFAFGPCQSTVEVHCLSSERTITASHALLARVRSPRTVP